MRIMRRLRATPGGAPVQSADGQAIDLPEGTRVEILEEAAGGWTKVRADFGGNVEGWVSSDGIAEGNEFSLSKAVFAEQCVDSGVTYGANAYYLMTVALQRTNIKSFPLGRPDGFVGPFALTAAEWDAMRNVPESLLDYPETQITVWISQVAAFAVSTHAMQTRVSELIGKEPSVAELFFAQVFGSAALGTALEAPNTTMNDIVAGLDAGALINEDVDHDAIQHRGLEHGAGITAGQALDATAALLEAPLDEAVDHVRPAADRYSAALAAAGVTVPQPVAALDFTSPYLNTNLKRTNAEKITSAFAEVGYGATAQIAAVANAIGESALNHLASNTNGEDSHGLFQLNRNGGVGTGHSVADLQDADKNIKIMLDHILEPHNKAARLKFLTTNKLSEAVQIFVYEFEKPADKAGATTERTKVAKSIKL